MDDATALEDEVAAALGAHDLLRAGDGVLVAASGGADSGALASLLVAAGSRRLPLTIVLGHVDHGWRGRDEAGADRAVVDALARRLGVPAAFAGPPDVVRRTEDDARRFRYGALLELATAHRCMKVATGHHLRDQAETFLLRLERGSGPAGLSGIPRRRPLAGGPIEVVRPLLDVDPVRLRAYANARGVPFRDDPTNAGLDRDRVRVRARLVDAEHRGTAVSRDLAAAADRFRRALERRERSIERRIEGTRREHPLAGVVEIPLAVAASIGEREWPVALRVLGRSIAADDDGPWFSSVHAALVARLVGDGAKGSRVELPRGRWVDRQGARLFVGRTDAGTTSPYSPPSLQGEGATRSTSGRVALSLERHDVDAATIDVDAWARERAATAGRSPFESALDGERLGGAVLLRAAFASDRFEPWGQDRTVVVDRFLARAGVRAELRRATLVLTTSSGEIAWVVGHRIDRRFAVTPQTARVALVTVRVVPRAR